MILQKFTCTAAYGDIARRIFAHCVILLALNCANQILSAKSGWAPSKVTKKLRHESGMRDGIETYVTKHFSKNGIELSGGEGQKLAVARAIYKNVSTLVLEELTASLDEKTGSEIYEDFFNMARGKTTIFISRRLAASTISANIAVFAFDRI